MALADIPKSEVDAELAGDGVATLEILDVTDRAEWDMLMRALPFPHLPQSWAYAAAKAAAGPWSLRRVVFRRSGRALAIATVLQLRVLGFSVLNRVNRGPVFLEANPTELEQRQVIAALRGRFGRFWRGPLLLAPSLEAHESSAQLLRDLGLRRWHARGWRSGRIDLTRSIEEIWAGLSSTFRNRFRSAQRAGASVRIADDLETYEWMIARHLENMQEKGFRAVGPDFLRTLRENLPEGDVSVFQLVMDGQPVAGMSVVRFGNECEYHIGWFGPEGRRINAGNALMWAIVEEMKRRGCTSFDLGGMLEGSGYTQFKRTMRSTEYELAGDWLSL
jgi:hypothetical protein